MPCGAEEPGQRGLAVAAVDAVSSGQVSPELVVRGFDEVAAALEHQPGSTHPVTLFRPGRLATSLDAIARRSGRHQGWALEVTAGAVARIRATSEPEPVPVGRLTPLLRLLVELTASLRSGVPPIAWPALRVISAGSGEGARLARTLLEASDAGPATSSPR